MDRLLLMFDSCGMPEWASPFWDHPDRVDADFFECTGETFPWHLHARAGLEYLCCPDTGAPDFSRKALTTRLYVAECGVRPRWRQWKALYGGDGA